MANRLLLESYRIVPPQTYVSGLTFSTAPAVNAGIEFCSRPPDVMISVRSILRNTSVLRDITTRRT